MSHTSSSSFDEYPDDFENEDLNDSKSEYPDDFESEDADLDYKNLRLNNNKTEEKPLKRESFENLLREFSDKQLSHNREQYRGSALFRVLEPEQASKNSSITEEKRPPLNGRTSGR